MFDRNLKYYRLKRNMSKKELAAACGLTPMAISNYESGKRMPDMVIIKRLAGTLGIHVVDFLESRNAALTFRHNEFRKNSRLTKNQQEYVKESVEEYFSRFFSAVDFAGGRPLPVPLAVHSVSFSGDFRTDALSLRKTLDFSAEGPIDGLIGALENKGILVMELDISSHDFSGMNGTVNEYPYIVINRQMTPERKRTTIAHELAHLFGNWDRIPEQEREAYATKIAGAFLIPTPDLIRELGIHRSAITSDMVLVCQEYGISMYLLITRASQEKIISDSLATRSYIYFNKAGWRQHEPQRVRTVEQPSLFRQLVYRAVNEEGLSIQKGAELLKEPVAELEEYCGRMEAND